MITAAGERISLVTGGTDGIGRAVALGLANRDDLGTAAQLGWTPPSPLYLVRMLLATRRARREAGR